MMTVNSGLLFWPTLLVRKIPELEGRVRLVYYRQKETDCANAICQGHIEFHDVNSDTQKRNSTSNFSPMPNFISLDTQKHQNGHH